MTTTDLKRKQATLLQLEAELVSVTSREPRVDLINQVLAVYVYTKPERAAELLEEQKQLFEGHELPDERLVYLGHLATFLNQRYDYVAAEVALNEARKLVDEYGSISQRIDLYIDLAGNLINQEAMERAESFLEMAVKLLENFPDDELAARADCRYAAMHLGLSNYPRAIQYYLQSLTVIGNRQRELSLKGHYFHTLINTGLGTIYERTGYPHKAIEAYQRTIERSEAIGLKGRQAWNYLNMGNAYWLAGETDKAAHYFNKVLESRADDSTKARAAALGNLGSYYIDREDFAVAEEYVDRAEAAYQALDNEDYVNAATMAIFRAKIREGESGYEEAIEQLKKAATLAELADSPQVLAEAYYELGRLYAETGDYRSAYLAQLHYDDHQLEYRDRLNLQQQRELEAKYESEAREKEAERLKLKAVQLQLRALRAQMNPHFLYNCLNSIQSFITTNKASTASKYLAQFAMLMRRSLEYTNLEYISLEDEIVFLTNYLEINCHLRFEGRLQYTLTVDEELEEDILGVPTMIIQPYVENSIEHGLRGQKPGRIDISFVVQDESTILATVEDNGVGRAQVAEIQAKDPRRSEHRSRGTEITLSRLRLLNTEASGEESSSPVTITDLLDDSGVAAGTRVTVLIPVVDMQLGRYGV